MTTGGDDNSNNDEKPPEERGAVAAAPEPKKPKRSRKTPPAGSPEAAGDKGRRGGRRTPPAGSPVPVEVQTPSTSGQWTLEDRPSDPVIPSSEARTAEPAPEPPEPEPEAKKGEPELAPKTVEPEPETKKGDPEAKEPEPAPEPEAKTAPPEPAPEPKTAPPEPAPEAKTAPPAPEPAPEAKTAPPATEPEPKTAPPAPEPEPEAKTAPPEPAPEPEAKTAPPEPAPELEAKTAPPEPAPEAGTAQPTPEAKTAQPAPEPEPEPEPKPAEPDAPPAPAPAKTAADYADPEAAALPMPEASVVPVAPVAPAPPNLSMLPDPAAAAFEAARIAGEIVGDIESASGAAIVAAAAAGAAIEAARARSRVAGGEPDADPGATAAAAAAAAAVAAAGVGAAADPGPAAMAAAAAGAEGASGNDPVVTVRMHRERVLRALAEGASAVHAPDPGGSGVFGGRQYARAATHPDSTTGAGVGETSSSGDESGEEEELDPVALAAAAIQRLRQRASTDFAELRVHYNRHDIFVVLAAFVIIIGAGWLHGRMTTPPSVAFSERGLVFEHSKAWLAPEKLPPPPPRIAHDPTGQPPKSDSAYHVAFTSSIDPGARIEVWIDKRPQWSNIVTNLDLERRTRWGELYLLDDSSVRSVEDQNWLRTAYRYAHVVDKGDMPRIDRAVEYATADREQIYVITLFGTTGELDRMEDTIIPTLRVPSKLRSALPLVPQTRSQAQRNYPNAVARAFDSTVMVVVADLIDGRLVARGGGTGVIVGADGSILTNFHVIHDKDGRLHDVFVIGRFSSLDRAPQLQCAGRPNRSKLQREVDLALIKCDTDLDGRTWTPAGSGVWATLPEAKAAEVRMGQRLWVLGYPDVGGGGLTLSQGEVEGWTGPDGTTGRDFIKTDASITNGNSGGPVVDDQGKLVGLASAYRTRIVGGTVVESSHRGLVRPLATASDLLAIAATGWTPREGHTDVDLQPTAVEAPAEGVRIATHVIDHASESPVADALVMVLRPGVSASAVDANRLDDQVLAWGRSNMQGEVQLKQPVPVPGTYTVMVVARGYEALIGEGALHLDEKTPPAFDPWGEIRLRAR